MTKIKVQETEVTIVQLNNTDYISLTDMADAKKSASRAADIIKNWLRNRYTLEFLGTWEVIHNPNFKVVEFDHFKTQAGLPSFVLSVSEWIEIAPQFNCMRVTLAGDCQKRAAMWRNLSSASVV